METIIEKLTAINKLRKAVSTPAFFEIQVNLNHFFNPLTFLNAHRQYCSRKSNSLVNAGKMPIDSLQLLPIWNKNPVTDQILVQGIYIQGCRFDGCQLSELSQHDNVVSTIPVFKLAWVTKDDVPKTPSVSLPVYVDQRREKLVTNLLVPISGNPDKWILFGVAFFITDE
jgi:hypothetical protein